MNTATPSALVSSLIASMDLDDYEDMATGTVVLLNPATQAPTTSTITLASREHQSRKQIDMARTRKLRNTFNQTGKMPVSDPVDDVADETDYLVASTLGWNLTQGGAPLLHSADAARKLYADPKKQWLRTQVLAALNKSELFISSSAKP
jgi:hypothetical protein